jgi:hypothetical protein
MKIILILPLCFLTFFSFAQIKVVTKDKIQISPNVNKSKIPVAKEKESKYKLEVGQLGDNISPDILRNRYALKNNIGGTKITTYIEPINKISTTTSAKSNKPKNKGTSETDDLICKKYSVSLNLDAQSFAAPLAEKMAYIYPGAAYDYNKYISNNVQPGHNLSPRNPIIIQVTATAGTGKKILVNNPTKDNLVSAAADIKTSLPSQAYNEGSDIQVQSIVNEATFALNIGAGGGGFGFNIAAKFGLSYNSKKTYMSIDATQKNFTLTADLPDHADRNFYKDSIQNTKSENVYMSSVTYGRRVIGIIESELDEKYMEAGVKASYNGFGVSANIGMDILDKMSSGKTTVRLLFIGGKAEAISVPNPTQESVRAAINRWLENTNAQAAVPISYTLKNMRHVGMRWETVTDNITYDQCIPKPPAAAIPQDWDIKITLNSISNNKRESVKLGVQQFVGVGLNDNKWKNENGGKDVPILCWMQDWNGCQIPPHIDFSGPYRLGTVRNYSITNDEYEQNPIIRIETRRIVMYATGIGGSKNANDKTTREDKRVKDIGSFNSYDVPVHVNGRIFKFNYTVEIRQRAPVQ